MSNISYSTTTQQRVVVGTFEEALSAARDMVAQIDAWAGATVGINPVMRDHETQQFQWEVMVSGVPVKFDPQAQ